MTNVETDTRTFEEQRIMTTEIDGPEIFKPYRIIYSLIYIYCFYQTTRNE